MPSVFPLLSYSLKNKIFKLKKIFIFTFPLPCKNYMLSKLLHFFVVWVRVFVFECWYLSALAFPMAVVIQIRT